ncbi:MAG: hypothetical protein ACRC7S_12780 [Cetobacterium sp.]
MKIGLRDYTLSKSIGMMGSGQLKRQIMREINPMYGKKGMGKLNPNKYSYNKLYERFTFGGFSQLKVDNKSAVRVFLEKLLGL